MRSQQQMNKIVRVIKGGILKLDLFDSGSLLRVKGEPEHKTVLGGMVSLSVMVILLVAFYNRIIDTFDKVLITSSASNSNAYDPPALNLNTVGKGPFMLGAEVFNLNLNEGIRYFDILLTSYKYKFGDPINQTEIRLESCTPDHWRGYPEIQSKFQHLNMGNWMCLPKNSDFEVKGKYSSSQSKTFSVQARTCSNDTLERPCATQQEMDLFFKESGLKYFSVYFINPLINPENQDYLTYYMEDTNYITFSSDYGGEGLLFVEDYSISTDNSILPTSSIQTESGGIISASAMKNTYIHNNQTFATFAFLKSSTTNNISRRYQKLDNVFSYIGGLFGTVLIFFFLVSAYNTYKFEVNLAGYLYRAERKVEVEGHAAAPIPQKIQKEYNFFHFLAQGMFALLRMMGCRPQWKQVGRYYRVRQEMLKQLDVLFLIKRINFLERSLSFLFTPLQIKALHLTNQLTMADAVAIRHSYKLKNKLQREIRRQRGKGSDVSPSKNDVSSQLIVIQGNNTVKHTFEPQQESDNNFPLDSDHYSSESSSSQQQQSEGNSVLNDIVQLQRDRQNQVSRAIWQGIDKMIRKMIEHSAPHHRFDDVMNEVDRSKLHKNLRPETISFYDLMPEYAEEQDQPDRLRGIKKFKVELDDFSQASKIESLVKKELDQ